MVIIPTFTAHGRMKMCGILVKSAHYFTETKFSGCLCPCLVGLIIQHVKKKMLLSAYQLYEAAALVLNSYSAAENETTII